MSEHHYVVTVRFHLDTDDRQEAIFAALEAPEGVYGYDAELVSAKRVADDE